MITFLLIIFLGVLAWNYLLPYLLRRKMRSMFGFDPRQQSQQQRRRKPEPPQRHAKKIDPSVGEYVEFTETTETTTRQTVEGPETTIRTEQQITDVQWEDLP